ncbi:hypothetical protein CA982_09185 [Gordonia lacunae]|uniref:Uncharacterized protein n=1 Tax=Gordonia lacunae TaxID=417102 RepID=A0A243QC86_9ACTN|nr:hypothetical protein CA982_09185 [Gordonia lacunae]
MGITRGEKWGPSTVHPIPSTVRPFPSTVRPIPSTVRPIPSTVRRVVDPVRARCRQEHEKAACPKARGSVVCGCRGSRSVDRRTRSRDQRITPARTGG